MLSKPISFHLIEQAPLDARDDSLSNANMLELMLGSCVGVWAVAGGIYHLSNKKRQEAEAKPLVQEAAEDSENMGGAVGITGLSFLMSIPALFAQ